MNAYLIEAVESPFSRFRPGAWLWIGATLVPVAIISSDIGVSYVVVASTLAISLLLALYDRNDIWSTEAMRVLADTALLTPIPVWAFGNLLN